MMPAGQLQSGALSVRLSAAAFVFLFLAVDAKHFFFRQLGQFRAGSGFFTIFAEPALDFDFKARAACQSQQH